LTSDVGWVGANGDHEHASCEDVVRIVETHSGVSDVLGSARGLERLAQAVTLNLEGGRAGTRFPLLRVLLRKGPVSAQECDALAREVVRLRAALKSVSFDPPTPASRPSGDPALDAAAPLSPTGPARPLKAPHPTLADLYARALSVAEHVARLGGASRRGVRVEVGPDLPDDSTRARLRAV
jgi:hypothetical protein